MTVSWYSRLSRRQRKREGGETEEESDRQTCWGAIEADTDRRKNGDVDVIVIEKAFVEELPLAQCWVILWECEWRKHRHRMDRQRHTYTVNDSCRGSHTESTEWNRPCLVMSIVKYGQYWVSVQSAYLLLSCCLWCVCLANAYQALGVS